MSRRTYVFALSFPSPPTVGEFLAAYLAELAAEKSTSWGHYERAFRLHLLPHFERVPLTALSTPALVAWIARLKATPATGTPSRLLAANTVRAVFCYLQSALALAVSLGLIPTNPARDAARWLPQGRGLEAFRGKSRLLAQRELASLLACPRVPWWARLEYAALALSGLRIGEMRTLCWRDVALFDDTPHFVVARSWGADHTKTRRSRRVPIHPELRGALLEYLQGGGFARLYARQPRPEDRLFPHARKAPPSELSRGRRTKSLHYHITLAGVHTRIGFHGFRHTFAEALRAADVNMETIAALLGHVGSSVTHQYARPTLPMMARALEKLPSPFRELHKIVAPGSALVPPRRMDHHPAFLPDTIPPTEPAPPEQPSLQLEPPEGGEAHVGTCCAPVVHCSLLESLNKQTKGSFCPLCYARPDENDPHDDDCPIATALHRVDPSTLGVSPLRGPSRHFAVVLVGEAIALVARLDTELEARVFFSRMRCLKGEIGALLAPSGETLATAIGGES